MIGRLWTDRQEDRNTDKQSDRQRDRHKYRYRNATIPVVVATCWVERRR